MNRNLDLQEKYKLIFDEETIKFIELSYSFGNNSVNASVSEIREQYNKAAVFFNAGRPSGVTTKDHSVKFEHNELKYREYNSKKNNICDVIYLHGGGFVVGDLESHDDICAEICDFTGSRVLSLDYSLAPEHKYPQFYSDSIRFYYFIKNSGRPVVMVGDSAGGNLAAFITYKSKDTPLKPKAQVLIYPSLGGSNKKRSYKEHASAPMLTVEEIEYYREQADIPLTGSLGDLLGNNDNENMPNTLLVNAEIDPLASDCEEYYNQLLIGGCNVNLIEGKGLPHGFLRARNYTKRAKEVFKNILHYIRTETQPN